MYQPQTERFGAKEGSSSAANEAELYKVGIYGWRKRGLYALIVLLFILIVINLALTVWIMKALRFQREGMGGMSITSEGIYVEGEAEFASDVYFENLKATEGKKLSIESDRGVQINARDAAGEVVSSFHLDNNQAMAMCDVFEIYDRERNLIFATTQDEVAVNVNNLRILGEGGAAFSGSLQTNLIRPERDSPLTLHSPTRSVDVVAAGDVKIVSAGGDVRIESLLDISMTSKNGPIIIDAQSMYIRSLHTSPDSGGARAQLQLCMCNNGRLFLARSKADCRATREICNPQIRDQYG